MARRRTTESPTRLQNVVKRRKRIAYSCNLVIMHPPVILEDNFTYRIKQVPGMVHVAMFSEDQERYNQQATVAPHSSTVLGFGILVPKRPQSLDNGATLGLQVPPLEV